MPGLLPERGNALARNFCESLERGDLNVVNLPWPID